MATHPMGAGTVNLSVNMRQEERLIIGQSAFKRIQRGEFRSVGDFVRGMVLQGLEQVDSESAARLRAIRPERVVVRIDFNHQERKEAA